ncbi:putative leucine-rich repeat domain, L domain-containing protein [Medicago truncatula]|nr:putative leucine-rich repeat domain, L domain-containing protein [Medicago truncatula]
MKNITRIRLFDTSIEKLPVSFQKLTGLLNLIIIGNGMLRLPSSIFRMPALSKINFEDCLLPKKNDKLSSMVFTSRAVDIEYIELIKCNLSDKFLPILVMWSANVKTLDLSGNNFTILPECMKDCRFLWFLKLDDCKCLREIRGIPPNVKHLSAIRCKSLTSSCKHMLLNQDMHEAGQTMFCLPGFARIPEWFEHQNMGHTISFWFRNKLPSTALFFSTKSVATSRTNNFDIDIPTLIINDNINGFPVLMIDFGLMSTHHIYLCDMKLGFTQIHSMEKIILENEWIHAEVTCEHPKVEPLTEIGIHFFKQKNNMDDIQFTNPYEKIKLNDNDDDGDDVFYEVDDVLDDDNDGVFYDVDDEDDHHSQ